MRVRLLFDRGTLLPRWLAVLLRIRRLSPGIGERLPSAANLYHPSSVDTGGGVFRPPFRQQDPSQDPKEPWGGESSSRANEHGWNNCTMSSGGMVHGWHLQGSGGESATPWGGRLRHEQSDLEGGTDLYDVRDAWADFDGAELKIKSGQGWGALKEYRDEWRAIVLQGTGNTPGAGTYTGAHALAILPERSSSGEWLIADPLCSGYDWVPEAKLKEWALAFSSGVAFAVSKAWPPEEPPEPPEPPQPTPQPPPPPYRPAMGPAASWAIGDGQEHPWSPWDAELWEWGAWSSAYGSWGPVWYWPRPEPRWSSADWLSPWAG